MFQRRPLATFDACRCQRSGPLASVLIGLVAFSITATSGATEPDTQPTARDVADNSIMSLYDSFGEPVDGTTQAFGYSALIQYRGRTILFDAGSDADTLRSNAEALGVDLSTVDFAVLSHNHIDHFSGFAYFRAVNPDAPIYAPSDLFLGGAFPFDITGPDPSAGDRLPPEQAYYAGDSELTRTNGIDTSGVLGRHQVGYVSETRELAPGITLVLTRSELMGYFIAYPPHGTENPVHVGLPELSLSLRTEEGEVLVVGCSHPTVDAIAAAAAEFTDRPIVLLTGGFHLLPYDEATIRDVSARLHDELGVGEVAPAHCTGHLGFAVLREQFGDRYHTAGLGTRLALPD